MRVHRGLPIVEVKYSDDQPRGDDGRFVEDQGASPLDYTPSSQLHPDRLGLVDPAAGEHPKGDAYFAETRQSTTRGAGVVTPGAKPGTVAFVDYTKPRADTLHINYMKVRSDQRGQGHAARLVNELVARHPEVSTVDFGRIMHPAAGRIREQVAAAHPELVVTGKRDY